jgi:glycosyltransferase involved in cell wall biosynthesis
MTTVPHVVLVANTGWSVVRHRREQILGLVERGWRVSALATLTQNEAAAVRQLGAEPFCVPCEGNGANLAKNSLYFARLVKLLRRLRPDFVHNFSVKPSIWGTFAAKAAGVRGITCTITGAGPLRTDRQGVIQGLLRSLYRRALAGRVVTIFQNQNDLEFFVRNRLTERERTAYIPGCGVDIGALEPNFERTGATFIMASRMLWSKGVREFVEAARAIKRQYPESKFLLLGGSSENYSSKNPDFVPAQILNDITQEGVVEWRGRVPPSMVENEMRDAAAVVLLSSYAEGVPRALIEAAALGAPIITTDAPGCRDVVVHRQSGFLCRKGCLAGDASEAMRRLLEEPDLVSQMGRRGREIAMQFDKSRVLSETLNVYERTTVA